MESLSVCVCLLCIVLFTDTVVVLHFVAGRADAAEGAFQIVARSRGAGPWQADALVDVCTEENPMSSSPQPGAVVPTLQIREVSNTAWL